MKKQYYFDPQTHSVKPVKTTPFFLRVMLMFCTVLIAFLLCCYVMLNIRLKNEYKGNCLLKQENLHQQKQIDSFNLETRERYNREDSLILKAQIK
jgi:hypothetical protein